MKHLRTITIASLLLAFSSVCSFAETSITLNTADSSPYSKSDNTGFYDVLLSQAFDTLGITISINHLPSKRSIFNANAGIDDGEYARVKGISYNYENLILVDEKLVDFGFTTFSKGRPIQITDWNDLKDYNVAYINGWKIYENNVTSYKSLVTVTGPEELFQLLDNDRVDLILYEKWRGIEQIRKSGLASIYPSPTSLATKGMYLYLNKRHEALIPELEKIIQTMKSDGQYDKLVESILEN